MGSSKRNSSNAKEGTKATGKRKVTNRPPTRSIVRWNEELDKKLLLAIQSGCNTNGVKLPWKEIAKIMGNNISEGAIVQHLAKLRSRMVKAGMDVPPPLRRGGTAALSSAAKSAANTAGGNKPKTRKDRAKSIDSEVGSESDNIAENEYDDSDDDEYIAVGTSFLRSPEDEKDTGKHDTPKLCTKTKIVKLCISKEKLQRQTISDSAVTEQPVVKTEDMSTNVMDHDTNNSGSASEQSKHTEIVNNSNHGGMELSDSVNAETERVWIGDFPTDLTVPDVEAYFDWTTQPAADFPTSSFAGQTFPFGQAHANPFLAAQTSQNANTASQTGFTATNSRHWMSGPDTSFMSLDNFGSFGSFSSSGNNPGYDDQELADFFMLSNQGSFNGSFDSM